MKILLIGGGGREHALGWKLAQSSRVKEVISLPGNPGLAELGPIVEGIEPSDAGAISAMARVHGVDLVVVGPEGPLAAGVVDALTGLGIPAFGPTRAAARLEASKSFAKEIMGRAGVETSGSASFASSEAAHSDLDRRSRPYVVKADGLAAGKGVLVTDSLSEAKAWVDHCLDGGFGQAGSSVLIEDFLDGPEVSVFAVCTEHGAKPLAPARDYKRLDNHGEGPNTGGMGSYSPVGDLSDDLVDTVMATVIDPVLHQMADEGNAFRGFLYAGLVLTENGPSVLEFNVRLGDPEAQVLIPRMANDLVDVLEGESPEWSDQVAVNVVLAAKGYPERPETGPRIKGIRDVPDDVLVFHAGTRRDGQKLLVDGGRVLNLVGLGPDLSSARERAYRAADAISWPGMQFRTDIAQV